MSIELQNISFAYTGKQVLHNVCLNVEQGKALTILGPNGAGKTTLLNIMAGLENPSSGSILYDGKRYQDFSPRELAKTVGYVPQFITPAFDYSVVEYVVTGCAPQIGTFNKPEEKHYTLALEVIKEMGISHLAEKSYMEISGGERQQVSIARAIAQKPKYIFMDEPTSHLDFGNQIKVLKIIQTLTKAGYGVVFTTHNPDHALILSENTAILNRQGNLISGNGALLLTEENLSALYEVDLKISSLENGGRNICYALGLDS